MIALRISRKLGSGGASSIPRVITLRTWVIPVPFSVLPPRSATNRWRRSQSACAQISPSAWNSGCVPVAKDLAHVAERVAAGAGHAGARAVGVGARAAVAVEALGAQVVDVAAHDVEADVHLAVVGGVGLVEVVALEVVHRVPVAPALAHRARLEGAQRRVAGGVEHEAVREPVRVLVVDDRASSPPLDSGTELPLTSANRNICIRGGVPSAGVFMFALLRWSRSGCRGCRTSRCWPRRRPQPGPRRSPRSCPRRREAERRGVRASRGSC